MLNNEELYNINGGVTISGTLINSIAKLITTILDLGRAIGSAIRMVGSGSKCK